MVARRYASHVPLPASAQTSGMVAAGVVVGAMVETDCARVSSGERAPRRRPYPAASAFCCDDEGAVVGGFRVSPEFAGARMAYHTG